MKRVLKYATGQNIPLDAKYLCTEVESITFNEYERLASDENRVDKHKSRHTKRNEFVWHYYEVTVNEEGRNLSLQIYYSTLQGILHGVR